jgi:hypothetical protein
MHQGAISSAINCNGADLDIRQEWLPLFGKAGLMSRQVRAALGVRRSRTRRQGRCSSRQGSHGLSCPMSAFQWVVLHAEPYGALALLTMTTPDECPVRLLCIECAHGLKAV